MLTYASLKRSYNARAANGVDVECFRRIELPRIIVESAALNGFQNGELNGVTAKIFKSDILAYLKLVLKARS